VLDSQVLGGQEGNAYSQTLPVMETVLTETVPKGEFLSPVWNSGFEYIEYRTLQFD